MTPGESHKAEELSMDEIFLRKIRDYVIRNISSEAFSLEALVSESGYSRSQVHKKLKKTTGKSLSTFVREIRLEEALKLLKAKAGTASEIAYRTGFSSPVYFNQCFNDYFGITPGEASKRGIQKPESLKASSKKGSFSIPIRWRLRPVIIILAVLLIAVIILVYHKIFNSTRPEQSGAKGKITVAVMPFRNMTNDTTKNYCEKGIQILIENSLSNNNEILVRQTDIINSMLEGRGITNYTSLTPSIASLISRKLDADIFISGNIIPKGTSLRITAQLINSRTKEIIKPFQIEGPGAEENIIIMTDSLSAQINNYLVISVLEKELNELNRDTRPYSFTSSPEAYRKYMLGINAHYKSDNATAIKYHLDAIKNDSIFVAATWELLWVYYNVGIYDQAKKWCLELYATRSLMTRYQEAFINFAYACIFETPREGIKAVRQLLEIDNQNPESYRLLGYSYSRLFQYEKAIPELEKALDIFNKWDLKPSTSWFYTDLGHAYHETGQHRKERKLYRKAEKAFPDDYLLLYNQAILALSEGKGKAANKYIEKFIFTCNERLEEFNEDIGGSYWGKFILLSRESSVSGEDIADYLAGIYWGAGLLDNAEGYWREALRLRPESPATMNVVAFFLIDTGRNIQEGLDLVEKALELSPDHYEFLDTKGWGLFKQGKYPEALQILQKSWDLRMENAIYNHIAFLHLEEAKKAVDW